MLSINSHTLCYGGSLQGSPQLFLKGNYICAKARYDLAE